MIETKEQYEAWVVSLGQQEEMPDEVQTIEALRDIAKAAQFAKHMTAASFDTALNEQLDKLRAALDEIPDWIVDG